MNRDIECPVLRRVDPRQPAGTGIACNLATLVLGPDETPGGLLAAPALDRNIENEAVLVDGTPEPMLLAGEADDDLIEVPFVATARCSPTDPVGEFPAEFEAPLPDRLP